MKRVVMKINSKAWLHRRGTPYVWEFHWDTACDAYIHHARKHIYAIRCHTRHGYWIAREIDPRNYVRGNWIKDHRLSKPREIEFEDGSRFVFP